MEQISIKILDRLNITSLEIIKSEAEVVLEQLAETENITLNKANSIFQILVVMLVSIIGYLVTQITTCESNLFIIICCLIFSFSISIAIYLLFKIIYPAETALKGAQPSKILQPDIFDGTKYEIEMLLSNRICSLETAINKNIENQRKRIKLFKNSVKCIFAGLIIVVLFATFYTIYV